MKRIRDTFKRDEKGAALVEFAVMAPLLLVLLLGIVEFGWLLANDLDVRHGAREAARLAAVDAGDTDTMGDITCASMDFSGGQTVTFTDSASGDIGTEASVDVSLPYTSLTRFFGAIIPATLDTTVTIRLEQESDSWVSGARLCS